MEINNPKKQTIFFVLPDENDEHDPTMPPPGKLHRTTLRKRRQKSSIKHLVINIKPSAFGKKNIWQSHQHLQI
jgi:hypothetical protein